ncbi:MAG TPA: F0F1 ATP synthase subunit A [Terriglobales bacterium]|nr:F0F1 ATP synthase subunit A [Terriglobales bacterium]
MPGLLPDICFRLGLIAISASVVVTWALMAALAMAALLLARRPGASQALLEPAVLAMLHAVQDVQGDAGEAKVLLPFIGTIWIFLLCANLIGLLPGLRSPTSDLSVTASLALAVFLAVHVYGVRLNGWRDYLRHFVRPSPWLLPFEIIGELSRTLALAIRLFGNISSLELAAYFVLLVAGALLPVPILMLHIVEALLQAYIFGMLALVYIAAGLAAHPSQKRIEAAL